MASTEHTPISSYKKTQSTFFHSTMKIKTFEQARQNEQRLPGILHLERGRGMSRLHLLARSDCSGLEFHPGDKTKKNKPNEVSSLFFIEVYLTWDTFLSSPDPRREKTLGCCVFSKVALVCVLTALLSEEAHAWWRSTFEQKTKKDSLMWRKSRKYQLLYGNKFSQHVLVLPKTWDFKDFIEWSE